MYCQLLEVRKEKWDNKKMGFVESTPFLYSPCGSTCWFKLDGRNNLDNLKNDCMDFLNSHKNGEFMNPVGYQIFKNIRDKNPIYLYNPCNYSKDYLNN